MEFVFYFTAVLSVLCVALGLTSRQAVHALLFIVSAVLALSLNLYLLGNELFSVLLVVIYAGAIMVLFIFVVMLLNPVPTKVRITGVMQAIREFFGPLFISGMILLMFVLVESGKVSPEQETSVIPTSDIVSALFNDGWFFVELLSLLLTAAFVGAYYVGRRQKS